MTEGEGEGRIVNPNRLIVEAANAERIAQRRSTATLAADVARTSAQSLSRGPRRQVGGVFETIEGLPPATIKPVRQALTQSDISRFLSAFQFSPQREVLSRSQSITAVSERAGTFGVAFGGGADVNSIIERSRRFRRRAGGRRPRRRDQLFDGTIRLNF